MIKLGITGNIASGKTLLGSFLKEAGIPVIDADDIAHALLDNDIEIIEQVYNLFISCGTDVKNERGNISRPKIAQIVFDNPDKLKELEKIIHPRVREKLEEFFIINKNVKLATAIVPLLYEAEMQDLFDYMIMITVDKNIQLKRLMARNNMTEEEALKRINCQTPQEKNMQKADFIISNNDDIENTKAQLFDILNTRVLNN